MEGDGQVFMRRHTLTAALAGAATIALVAAGCGGSDDGGSSASGKSTKLTVWVMPGELPPKTQAALVNEFESTHKNVKVDIQGQEWDGIQGRTITALAAKRPPDVIEFGNTYTASFAEGLVDLSDQADALGAKQWFPGMAASAVVDGKTVAVPYLGGARVVLYRTDLFAQAGITETPKTLADLTAAADKLQAKFGSNPKFSPLYFPGRYWYGALPFVWDAGGDIAKQSDGKWTGALDSPESIAGLTNLKNLVTKYSKAPRDADELTPFQPDALGKGEAGMVIDQAFQIPAELKNFPKLTQDKFGVFALPGTNGPAPQLAGGSNIGVSAGTKNRAAALDFLKLWTSQKYEQMMATEGSFVPNTQDLKSVGQSNPILGATIDAISNSKFVPVSDKWATVEGANVMQDMTQAILSGNKSVQDAAKTASDSIASTLNG